MDSRRYYKMKGSGGFTLVEVIVSLVVAAILGAMLVAFVGSNVMKSANPVFAAQGGAYLNSIMENIGADYRKLMSTSSTPLTDLKTKIDALSTDYGTGYTAVTKRFTSFPAGTPVSEPATTDANGKVLKVTIIYQGLSVTALFTQ